MIGELRDRETVLAGIQAAETGHLVFVTLHTADTMQAFGRMLEFFDTKDHHFIRSSLAASLKAVAAQRWSLRSERHAARSRHRSLAQQRPRRRADPRRPR